MAELEQKEVGKKGKKKGRKKMSIRVDLTPMVDLGFLLVTFFMLTTTFSKPQTMEINLPVKPKGELKEEQQNALKASKAFTVLIGNDNKLYWYMGLPNAPSEGPNETNFSADGIRKILQEKNNSVKDMVVLIKPTDYANYKNVVDILDEMNISNIKRYALVDITPEDLQLMENK
ncbi:MAG: biopolymer transporter ExbD [Ignavibacterium sp.]|uniref:ExbD/TolR family protein n=1 Tax=Ignavibacterium album TaxID=591197 RepID=UPI0026F33F3D|nr:biopolymer transporter ExbD [Ignavibacterium album]MCA2005200.1 biopolymer transporter ExbD [Ignavibacterium sp.]MCX8106705.1 biopolymer transporter ExbD [Ignavibacterium album]